MLIGEPTRVWTVEELLVGERTQPVAGVAEPPRSPGERAPVAVGSEWVAGEVVPPWESGWLQPTVRVTRPRVLPGGWGRRGWGLAAWRELRAEVVRGAGGGPVREEEVRGRLRALRRESSLGVRELLRELSVRYDGGVTSRVGIDLTARGHEVRKLFYAGGYHRSVMREGLDPEEALQEVFRGLLIRNQGKCPWDAKKSSFGHYVHIVIRCVLSNYLRKERRRNQREFLSSEDQEGEVLGVDGVTGELEGGMDFHRRNLVVGVVGPGADLESTCALVAALEAGQSRREAAETVGRGMPWVEETLRRLRVGLRG